MKKVELIATISEKTGLTKVDSEKALSASLESIVETVAAGEEVKLSGFGTFEPRKRAEKNGINPQTKESIKIPAMVVPGFKAGKGFKDAVKG